MNKFTNHRWSKYLLALMAAFISAHFSLPAVAQEPDPVTVGINVKNRLEVALAVGPTTVDYSKFEVDLRAKLAAKNPAVGPSDLIVTAARAVSANTTSEFSWWVYDHAKPGSTAIKDDVSHNYIEPDVAGASTTHPYTNNNSHMVESNSGATMDFYGYASAAFKDFRYMPNSQKTKKIFEFAIREDVAYDALNGVGFFFNTNITGNYASNSQLMSGYLLFLTYISGKGLDMSIYKFKNVNTYAFHHTPNLSVMITNGSFVRVATSTIYNATDKFRRIKLEVYPTYISVYYNGKPEGTGNDAVLTTPIAADATPVNFTAAAAPHGVAGTQITLDNSYITGYGFGPMASYISHGCDRPTHLALQHLTMNVDVVRSLTEVVREPDWTENTKKFLINLNEDEIEDFSSNSITGELLNRLRNDDIYYIGWCSDQNADPSQDFLNKNDLKGLVVSIDDPATATYDQQLQAIADKIYERYWLGNQNDIVLTTDDVVLNVSGAEQTNSADPEWPDGKWKVVHNTDNVDNPLGVHPLSGQYLSDFDMQFNLPGEYDVYYCDQYIKAITAHRPPVPTFDIALNGDVPTITDNSYDPDDLSAAGIVRTTWSYQNIEDPSPTGGLTLAELHAALPKLEGNQIYLIAVEVEDKYGATDLISKQAQYLAPVNPGDPVDPEPPEVASPFGYFDIAPYSILKEVGNQSITLTDDSYDPQGKTITSIFTLRNVGTGAAVASPVFKEGATDVSSLPVGQYEIKLVVSNGTKESVPVTRMFSVVEDKILPIATALPLSGTFSVNTQIALAFSDQGGSGFKQQRVAVTAGDTPPEETDPAWTAVSYSANRGVVINTAGSNHIHWEAVDNAGNTGTGKFGPYTLNKKAAPLTLTANPAGPVTYPSHVTLTATFGAGLDPVPVGTVYFRNNNTVIGSAAIDGTGVAHFEYNPANTIPAIAGDVTFEAEFLGDANYTAATANLPYTINKQPAPAVTIGVQTSREYNAQPFEPTGINITPAVDYEVHYNGTVIDGTIYDSNTPPTLPGSYTVEVFTTHPGYEQGSNSADFEIYRRQISMSISMPANTAELDEAVTFTVTLSGVVEQPAEEGMVDQPAGEIEFSIGDEQISSSGIYFYYDDGFGAGTTHSFSEEEGVGEYSVKAEYIPGANDYYIIAPSSATIELVVTKKHQDDLIFVPEPGGEPVEPGETPVIEIVPPVEPDGTPTAEIEYPEDGTDNPVFILPPVEGGGREGEEDDSKFGDVIYEVEEGGEGVIEVDPETGEVTVIGPGTAVVVITKPGNDEYEDAEISVEITVKPILLTITAIAETVDYGDTPVFAYTITEGSLKGSDMLNGALAVDNLEPGDHIITLGTLTAGKKYVITFIEAVLTVNREVSKDVEEITVGDLPAEKNEDGSFSAVTDEPQVVIDIKVDPDATVEIKQNGEDVGDSQTVDLDYGENVIEVIVTTKTGSDTTKLVVVRYYDLIIYEYYNVPTISLNKENNGGYTFTGFRWFRDGEAVADANKPYYRITDDATYYCELTLEDGSVWRTIDIRITPRATLKAYPNPTQGHVTISSDDSQVPTGVIQVFDIFGRMVMQSHTNPFDMSSLNEGVYVIKLNGETVKVIMKK